MTRATDEQQFLIILLTWIYAVIWMSLPCFGFGSFKGIAILEDFCIPKAMGLQQKNYVAMFGAFGFLFPTIGCHLLLRRKLRKHKSNSLEAGVHPRKRKKQIKNNSIKCLGQ